LTTGPTVDFQLTDEQQQLQDAVTRFLQGSYGFEHRRTVLASPEGWSRDTWRGLAELGLLALRVPEGHGGLAQGAMDTALALQAAGPAMLCEPLLESAVVATALLADLASQAQQAELLPAMAGGDRIVVLAHQEPASRGEPRWVDTVAEDQPDGGCVLSGHKAVVIGAEAADEWLVSARVAGLADAIDGVSLFRVARGTPGVRVLGCPTIDGRRAADLHFSEVRLSASARVGAEGQAMPAIERALDLGLAGRCNEAVGVMAATVDATVEYLRTRQQFGQPIGRFQALQHRAVEMLMHLEQARSMALLAAMRCEATDADERQRVMAAAKVTVGQACRFIAQQAVQLHGGMGMTDELQVSHWFKRLLAIELDDGGTDAQLQRFARLSAARAA